MEAIEDDKVEQANEQVVRRLNKLHQAIELGDGLRRGHPSLLKLGLQLEQPGAGEFLILECGQHLGEEFQVAAGFLHPVRRLAEPHAYAIGKPEIDCGDEHEQLRRAPKLPGDQAQYPGDREHRRDNADDARWE